MNETMGSMTTAHQIMNWNAVLRAPQLMLGNPSNVEDIKVQSQPKYCILVGLKYFHIV